MGQTCFVEYNEHETHKILFTSLEKFLYSRTLKTLHLDLILDY